MKVFLAQTDTTVGFLSQDDSRLGAIKMRDTSKPFLKVFSDFQTLKKHTRVPNPYKNWVRRAKKTTFIVKNQAFRYVSDPAHASLIAAHGWFYSTSANPSGGSYDSSFCAHNADWIIEDARGLSELSPSQIFKLGHHRLQKLR